MSWVTVIWSMIASACLTLAAIYFLVWYRNRSAWARLFFSLTAASTAAIAFYELRLMQARTPAEVLAVLTWVHVPLFVWLVSTTWFVRTYLGAGRLWLAWTISGLRAFSLLVNVLLGQNLAFRNVTDLRHVQFLGEPVTVLGAVPNSATPMTQFATVLVLVFVADACVTAWRRGDHRKALMVGGSVEFFLIGGLGLAVAVLWGGFPMPMVFSLFYLGLVAVMGYELGHDVFRASQLVQELQASEAGLRESEARLSLTVDAADFGIWIRNLSRDEIWASEKWRELFGFTTSERLDFDSILTRLHPDDREGFEQTHAMAVAGADHGKYQTEFRLVLPAGSIRWISSQGRVESDNTGQPVLIRSASREVTERKRAELAVRSLSGRLLSAQEQERHRIARELHDNLSQQIALLAIEIEQVAMQSVGSPAPVVRAVRQLGERTAEISTEIHNMSHRLHSAKLEALGLAAAIRGHCHELLAHGVQVSFSDVDVPAPVSHDVELCLFRVVQEGLSNVVKHSGAREAHVTLTATREALEVSIADCGCGFDQGAAADRDGLGLASMRERLRLIGGELTIRSRAGEGTTIHARAPLPHPAAPSAADPVDWRRPALQSTRLGT